MEMKILVGILLIGMVAQAVQIAPRTNGSVPFQAHYEWVHVKTSNGQLSEEITSGMLYRDVLGRERIEEYLEDEQRLSTHMAKICDPVSRLVYGLNLKSKTIIYRHPIIGSPTSGGWTVNDHLIPRKGPWGGESIGQMQIEGLLCQGRRIRRENGGVIEYWYSDDLMEIISLNSKSGDEVSKLRLFNIHLVEPDPNLFLPPN